jgi:membrane protease YdiL (CAAX protease family)
VVVAVAAAVVLSLVSGPITTRFGTPDLTYFASMGQHPMQLVEWLAITWTTAALGEEIVFRGYLVPQLAPVRTLGRAGWVIGIGVSSAFFGLAHSYQGAGGAIASGIVGAVFAIAFALDRRNLWRTIIAHGLFDTASLLLLFVALRHPPSV